MRNRIRISLREVRATAGYTQQQLAAKLGLSRFTIMRLEAGSQDLRLDQAQGIEEATGSSALVELVEARDRLEHARRGAPSREVGVRSLLERTGIHRVDVSLVDDLALHEFVDRNPKLANADVSVVVPTIEREKELFGDHRLSAHYERELKSLSDLSERRAAITVYESKRILQPGIIVRTSTGDECAVWPLMLRGDALRGANAPIIRSQDPTVIEEFASHINWALDGQEVAQPVYKNEVLGVLGDEEREDGTKPILFVGYSPHGEEDGEVERTNVGLAVSLLVVHGVTPREGLPPRRRFLLYKREHEKHDPNRWSLLSNHVDDADVRRAIARESEPAPPSEWRAFETAEDAAVRDSLTLEKQDFEIPSRAFRYAAKRELATKFGLDLNDDDLTNRLKPLPLPARLAQIDKFTEDTKHRRPILPSVFTLDLEKGELRLLRESSIETQAFGYKDLPTDGDDGVFNDFLVAAAVDGWLSDELKKLGVVEQ